MYNIFIFIYKMATPIPSSGAVSFSDLRRAFPGTTGGMSISQYYRGSTNIQNRDDSDILGQNAASVPLSGAFSMNTLRGVKKNTIILPCNSSNPGKLLAGNASLGYFGEVPVANFVNPSTVANNTSGGNGNTINQGTGINDSVPWLKFVRNGKILYITKKNVRKNISWNHLYECGAVYPSDTGNGRVPGRNVSVTNNLTEGTNEVAAANQTRKFYYGTATYDVRLMTGASKDPCTTDNGSSGPYLNSSGGEWDDLIVRVYNGTWASYSESDLGIGGSLNRDENGSWMQEAGGFYSWGSDTNNGPRGYVRIMRGFQGSTGVDISTSNKTYFNQFTGGYSHYNWRPVLEVLP